MPASQLTELARAGDYAAFEARCLELLEGGHLGLAQLVGPFQELQQAGLADKLAVLTQMVFDNVAPAKDPQAALALACVALIASPRDATLRQITIDLYRQVYGQTPGFDAILEASGLGGGRPVRSALKMLDLCLALKAGDALISLVDGHVVEVTDIDHEHGLFTLRRAGRATTLPAPEVARDYDRVAVDDFRVLRQLRPEQLAQLIQNDPVAVVIGLIHAHGGHIDADLLKHELVPKHIPAGEWSRWWTRARTELKRSPHVIVEGRSPMILTYCAEGQTLETETWATLQSQKEPIEWMTTVEGYVREKANLKEQVDADFLRRFHDQVATYIEAVRARRPAEALTCALILTRLAAKGVPLTDQTRTVADEMLREAADPGALLAQVDHDGLREEGWRLLETVRPDDWVQYAVAGLPTASASLLDELASAAVRAGHVAAVQTFVDAGLADLAGHPELVYWLWKGPKAKEALKLPDDAELFRMLLDAMSTLGRSIAAEPEVVKQFRHRVKAAWSLRNYDRVRRCLKDCSEAAAITIRRQLQRLEGVGQVAQAKLLDLLREVHPQMWVVKPVEVAPWDDAETVWCTAAGLAKRTAERDDIVNVKMRDNARRIGEAASHGDLSENSEYKFALEERDLLRARLAKINDDLSRARVLEPHDVPEDQVGIGTRVMLRRVDSGAERVMTFLGPFETDVDAGIYSYQAPVSRQLMGGRVGMRLNLALDGQDAPYEIMAVASAVTRRTS